MRVKEDFNKGIIFSKGEKMPAPFNKAFNRPIGNVTLDKIIKCCG